MLNKRTQSHDLERFSKAAFSLMGEEKFLLKGNCKFLKLGVKKVTLSNFYNQVFLPWKLIIFLQQIIIYGITEILF